MQLSRICLHEAKNTLTRVNAARVGSSFLLLTALTVARTTGADMFLLSRNLFDKVTKVNNTLLRMR